MDLSLILSIAAAAISLTALILLLILFPKVFRYLSDMDSHYGIDHKNGSIRSEIIDVVSTSSHIKQLITDRFYSGRANVHNAEISAEKMDSIIEKAASLVEKRIVLSNPLPSYNPPCRPLDQEKKTNSAPVPQENEPNISYKYATSYDLKNKTFYNVENRPSEDTIYVLSIDAKSGSLGSFSIYKNAYRKVSECRDFLEGACDVSGSGQDIQIDELGTVSLENGKWTVDTPLVMKFI